MSEENNSNGLAKQEERSLGLACHLLAFVGMVFPFCNILLPLVIWMVKKDDSAFVDDQGKEALNFNITISIAGFVAFLLTFVVIGAILLPIIGIFWLVMTIVAAVKANGGEHYRYPLTIRLIK